ARAYEFGNVSKETIVAQLKALSKEQFVEQIWLERYRELVFEWKDWNMIQRTRKYPKTNAMDSSIPKGTAQFVDVTTVGPEFTTKNFTVNNLLWPFPLQQTQRNPNLTQNPGY
ncbi:MAG: RagB/SusD family nutrient uptake outer membrane protein, partial [Tannerella sp.]|nr:RagB/SusD family nutrient uptake outer membrane protein [Tannerella sp.]